MSDDVQLWLICVNPFVRIWDFIEGVCLAEMITFTDGNIKFLKVLWNGKTWLQAMYTIFEMLSIVILGIGVLRGS